MIKTQQLSNVQSPLSNQSTHTGTINQMDIMLSMKPPLPHKKSLKSLLQFIGYIDWNWEKRESREQD